MQITKKKKIYNLFLFLLVIFCVYYLSKNYNILGFFADDGTTLYYLLKDLSLTEVLFHSFNWDAARDLHLIWQKFFILISGKNVISNLHFYQIIFYLINSILFCIILKKLNFKNEIIIIIWISSIFFPIYSEVVFWIHAFTMILLSTSFFLIFVIIQMKTIKKLSLQKNLYQNFLAIIFLLLSLFTYEQCIFAAIIIVFLISFIKFKRKFISFKETVVTTLIYSFIIISFAVYKLSEAGFFNPDVIKYQTGSNIVLSFQIFTNFILGFGQYIIQFFNFYTVSFFDKNFIELIIFNILLLATIYPIIFNYKKNLKNFKINSFLKKIFVFLVLFIASLTPLYFHYLSDRHYYLPSFFMFIGIAFALEYFLFSKKTYLFRNFFIFLIFFYSTQFLIKFELKKNQVIENFSIKKDFYKNLLDSKKIDFSKKKIYLINFPDLNNGEVFFAHEPEINFKLIQDNENLPFILRQYDEKDMNNLVYFNEIKNKRIIYEIR